MERQKLLDRLAELESQTKMGGGEDDGDSVSSTKPRKKHEGARETTLWN